MKIWSICLPSLIQFAFLFHNVLILDTAGQICASSAVNDHVGPYFGMWLEVGSARIQLRRNFDSFPLLSLKPRKT